MMKNHVYVLLVALMVMLGGVRTVIAGSLSDCLDMFAGQAVPNGEIDQDCREGLGYMYLEVANPSQQIAMYYNAQQLGIVMLDYRTSEPVPAPPLSTREYLELVFGGQPQQVARNCAPSGSGHTTEIIIRDENGQIISSRRGPVADARNLRLK